MMRPPAPETPDLDSERRATVERLHRTIPVIDCRGGAVRDGGAGPRPVAEGSTAVGADVARALLDGLGGRVFALAIRPPQYGGAAHAILRQYETLMRELEAPPQQAALCTAVVEIERAHASGKLAAILGLAGGEALEGDVDLLHAYYHLGVRILAPVGWGNNELADGAWDAPERSGLTPFGRQVVREMVGLGIVIDTAHLSERGFWDVLECMEGRPVVCSHANIRGGGIGTDDPCRLTDRQVKALAETGGVLGIGVAQRHTMSADPTVSELMRAFTHVAELVGAEHVGFGSGCGEAHRGAGGADARDLPQLTGALLDAGFTERELLGILGGNVLRVCRAVWRT